MNRMGRGYEARVRALLRETGARRVETGLVMLRRKAAATSLREGIGLLAARERAYLQLLFRVGGRQASCGEGLPPVFYCDSGLGGLARWIRAAGYAAEWKYGIDDAQLLKEAAEAKAILITTDSMLMERRLLRDGVVRSFWIAPVLRPVQQLELVLREFRLPVGNPRCMQCGGAVASVDREAMRSRIPPRTYRWKREFFACGECGRLLWHGTHWQRIQAGLTEAGAHAEAFWKKDCLGGRIHQTGLP